MGLTDISVRNAKPAEKPFKLADSGGLFLFVTPRGGCLWRLKYRVGGKEKLLSIGPYPLIGLRDAREARDKAKRQLLDGVDPSAAKRDASATAAADRRMTFDVVAADYIDKLKREHRAVRTLKKNEWLISLASPSLGELPMRDIKATDILPILTAIEARGHGETAKRLRSTLGTIFRYAVATGRADNDPTAVLKGALARIEVKPRAALTEVAEFAGLLRSIWGYDGTPETAAALKLMALLHPRPGELRQAEWKEFDLTAAVWTVPAARMKMRKPHKVSLPPQAVGLLEELKKIAKPSDFVFPSIRSADRCMSDNTMNAALRRLGYTTDEATSHGFRASFSTLANKSKLWHPDAIERDLAHIDENAVRRAYDRGDHWDERVLLAAWWADQCDAMRAGAPRRRRLSTSRSRAKPRATRLDSSRSFSSGSDARYGPWSRL